MPLLRPGQRAPVYRPLTAEREVPLWKKGPLWRKECCLIAPLRRKNGRLAFFSRGILRPDAKNLPGFFARQFQERGHPGWSQPGISRTIRPVFRGLPPCFPFWRSWWPHRSRTVRSDCRGPGAGETRPQQPGQPTPPVPVEIEREPAPASLLPGDPAWGDPAEPAGGSCQEEAAPLPAIQGDTPYSPEEVRRILGSCAQQPDRARSPEGLRRGPVGPAGGGWLCEQRVYVRDTPAPGGLEVVEGRLVELRVTGADERLNRRVFPGCCGPCRGACCMCPRWSGSSSCSSACRA